jgi:hypothetical protein
MSTAPAATVVLAGAVGARVGDRVVEAAAGASLVKPRGIPHAMWNAGAEPARVLQVLSPAGLEDYFEELAPVLRAKAAGHLRRARRTLRPHHPERLDRGAGADLRGQAVTVERRRRGFGGSTPRASARNWPV